MVNEMNARDLEMISSYLDGKLTAGEKARLEASLQSDSELKKAYEQMRRTRMMLRAAPKARASRNYMLRPEMVRAKKPQFRLYPIFRLSTAVATLLLVVAIVGEFFLFSTQTAMPLRVDQPTEAPMEKVFTEAVEAVPQLQAIMPTEQALQEMAPTPEGTQQNLVGSSAVPAPGIGGGQAESTPEPSEEMAQSNLAPIPDQATQPSIMAEASGYVTPEEAQTAPLANEKLIYRTAEILLVFIAILSAVAFILLRRWSI
jgi:hypothetical protein